MTANDQPPLFQRQDDDKTHIHRVRATATTNQSPLFQHDDHDMRGATGRARTIGRDWQSFPVPRDRPTGVAILALFIGGLNALLGCLVVFALSALGVYAILLLLLLALNVWVGGGIVAHAKVGAYGSDRVVRRERRVCAGFRIRQWINS